MSLARKYRPTKFHQILGQDLICQALLQSINLNHKPQALIFSGTRGTGKTTLARLYAAAVNCQHSQGFELCSGCPSCDVFFKNSHPDIIEIDGASNNGVEDIRRLCDTILYMPQKSTTKVYIIDEVHMLSISAFNALLKTLEEPPPHVIFLFATTELSKLPATVISRCQTYHLKRIPQQLIINRLKFVLQSQNIPVEEKSCQLIASLAQGSLRDALTILDQVLAIGNGIVQFDSTQKLLGYIPLKDFLPLWKCLASFDHNNLLLELDKIFLRGIEPKTLLNKLAITARNSWLIKELDQNHPHLKKISIGEDEFQKLQACNDLICSKKLRYLFKTLILCLKDLQGSSLDDLTIENSLFEWCIDQQKNHQPSTSKSHQTLKQHKTTSKISFTNINTNKDQTNHNNLSPSTNSKNPNSKQSSKNYHHNYQINHFSIIDKLIFHLEKSQAKLAGIVKKCTVKTCNSKSLILIPPQQENIFTQIKDKQLLIKQYLIEYCDFNGVFEFDQKQIDPISKSSALPAVQNSSSNYYQNSKLGKQIAKKFKNSSLISY